MKFRNLIEGLQILARYEDRGLDAHVNGADHDVIWAATAAVDDEESADGLIRDMRLSDEDNARLHELGWFISREWADAWTAYC